MYVSSALSVFRNSFTAMTYIKVILVNLLYKVGTDLCQLLGYQTLIGVNSPFL